MSTHDVGAIVGRFQVPELHTAHRELIGNVCDKHDKVIVALGLSPLVATVNNPLDFEARKQMLLDAFPNINVVYIKDQPEDARWSKQLDSLIADLLTPSQSALLYGGRDSFIPQYTGRFETAELKSESYVAGSTIRREVSRSSVRANPDFRAGVVWGAYARYPTVYPTVDVAILDEDGQKLLLARKENETGYRFIGGFSEPASVTFESDARREVSEEAGIDITDPRYLASINIDDWRYRNERDQIRTLLFIAKYRAGRPTPGSDICELRWMTFAEAAQLIRKEHEELLRLVDLEVNGDSAAQVQENLK